MKETLIYSLFFHLQTCFPVPQLKQIIHQIKSFFLWNVWKQMMLDDDAHYKDDL
jgi:hypothetical protein